MEDKEIEKENIEEVKRNIINQQIGDVSRFLINESDELKGFKLFFFKFYVKLITVKTVIKLCEIKAKIDTLTPPNLTPDDMYDSKLVWDVIGDTHKLYYEYITVGLLNNRLFSKLMYPFLYKKVSNLNWQQIYALHAKITEKSSLGFFLILSNQMTMKSKVIIK